MIALANRKAVAAALRSVPVLLLLACAACSGADQKPLVQVEGKVLCNGKPAEGALVFLHGEDAAQSKAVRPHGVVGPDGTFHLSTYKPDDGAPAGTYGVAVYWAKASKLRGDYEESLLPPHFADPATSGIPPLTIEDGSGQLPVITITR